MPKKYLVGLDFASIVRSAIPDQQTIETRQCPDICVGRISNLSKQSAWLPIDRVETPNEKAKLPSVILVLESPHKDEYRSDPLPANGTTGRHIRKFAGVLAQSLGVAEDSDLVILNAVPYQCSLGRSTKLFRSRVFRQAWVNGGSELFIARLKTWYREGDVIVNACTAGRPGKPLRDDVEDAIDCAFPFAGRARRRHPYCWMTAESVNQEWARASSMERRPSVVQVQ